MVFYITLSTSMRAIDLKLEIVYVKYKSNFMNSMQITVFCHTRKLMKFTFAIYFKLAED